MNVIKYVSILFLLITTVSCTAKINNDEANYYYIWGQKHIFKIFTPNNWMNNIEVANSFGLSNLFHPRFAVTDNSQHSDVFIFTQGMDRQSSDLTFEKYVKDALQYIKKSQPQVSIEKKTYNLGKKGYVQGHKYYTFKNFSGHYAQDCVYIDTNETVIILVYDAINLDVYQKFKPVFHEFITKFEFISSDPSTIKRVLADDRKKRGTVKEYKVPKDKVW